MEPCLCGDPYCSSCGSPGAAKLEDAEQWLMERLHKAVLSAEEYAIIGSVGLAAVFHARRAAKDAMAQMELNAAEAAWAEEAEKSAEAYWKARG